MSQPRSPPVPARRAKRPADWSRATHAMPASFADQPVQGRREDDGLDLVEAVTAAAAFAAVAELASRDELAGADAVGVNDEDVVAAADEGAAEPDREDGDPGDEED